MSHHGCSTLCSTLCLPQIRPFCVFNGRRTLLLFYLCGPQNCIVVRSEWERVEEWGAQAHVLHTAGRIKKAYQMRTTAAAAAGRQRCHLSLSLSNAPRGVLSLVTIARRALTKYFHWTHNFHTWRHCKSVCVWACVEGVHVCVLPCGTFCLACALFMPAICLFVW